MYREECLPGKGLGCVASRSISRGCLVLREKPALYLEPGLRGGHLEKTLTAFQVLSGTAVYCS